MADTTVTNPSPKARFIANPNFVKTHRAMMQDPALQQSIDMALLHYQGLLCDQRPDGSGAAANHFKITGALEFIGVLKNLAETPSRPETKTDGNLKHV